MIKLFISQPMNGRTDEEILAERERVAKDVQEVYEDEVEVIDSLFADDASPLELLGRSIQLMAGADLVYFARGWGGCKIEHACAEEYGKEVAVEMDLNEHPDLQASVDKFFEKLDICSEVMSVPKWKTDACAACGAESVIRHAGKNNNHLEYWAECVAHPQKHRTSCFKTAREAATRWNQRQKTLMKLKPRPLPIEERGADG